MPFETGEQFDSGAAECCQKCNGHGPVMAGCTDCMRIIPWYPFLANVNSRLLYAVARPSVVCVSSVTFVRPTQPVEIFDNFSTALITLAIS